MHIIIIMQYVHKLQIKSICIGLMREHRIRNMQQITSTQLNTNNDNGNEIQGVWRNWKTMENNSMKIGSWGSKTDGQHGPTKILKIEAKKMKWNSKVKTRKNSKNWNGEQHYENCKKSKEGMKEEIGKTERTRQSKRRTFWKLKACGPAPLNEDHVDATEHEIETGGCWQQFKWRQRPGMRVEAQTAEKKWTWWKTKQCEGSRLEALLPTHQKANATITATENWNTNVWKWRTTNSWKLEVHDNRNVELPEHWKMKKWRRRDDSKIERMRNSKNLSQDGLKTRRNVNEIEPENQHGNKLDRKLNENWKNEDLRIEVRGPRTWSWHRTENRCPQTWCEFDVQNCSKMTSSDKKMQRGSADELNGHWKR